MGVASVMPSKTGVASKDAVSPSTNITLSYL